MKWTAYWRLGWSLGFPPGQNQSDIVLQARRKYVVFDEKQNHAEWQQQNSSFIWWNFFLFFYFYYEFYISVSFCYLLTNSFVSLYFHFTINRKNMLRQIWSFINICINTISKIHHIYDSKEIPFVSGNHMVSVSGKQSGSEMSLSDQGKRYGWSVLFKLVHI